MTSARPLVTDASFGRFVACGPGFYDPAVYAKDRSLTVLGTVEGVTDGTVDGALVPLSAGCASKAVQPLADRRVRSTAVLRTLLGRAVLVRTAVGAVLVWTGLGTLLVRPRAVLGLVAAPPHELLRRQ